MSDFNLLHDDLIAEAGELLARHRVVSYSDGHFIRGDYAIVPEQEAKAIEAQLAEIMSPITRPFMKPTEWRDAHIRDLLRIAPKGKRSKWAAALATKYGLSAASLRVLSYRREKL